MNIHLATAIRVSGLGAAAAAVALAPAEREWNARAAASYLDERQGWWMTWPTAARDHETSCVSCHTALPYALARPALRAPLHETQLSPTERQMLDNIARRVRMWKDVEPFYDDQSRGLPKTSESRGTESVLNALILARYDAASGTLGADTRTALSNMWALQFTAGTLKGSWAWLNFRYAPWESDESQYWGTTLAAIAAGTAPGYQSAPELRERLTMLREFLGRTFDTQPLHNRAFVLWAQARLNGIISEEQRQATLRELFAKQQPDGGWNLASLAAWTPRRDRTPFETRSDGYATGVIAYVLQQAGVARTDEHVANALAWLAANQDATAGTWTSYSLNRSRDRTSDVGRFMSDAATAYASLALSP
jgi:squalene-hopene/tetraprenyl-beta-curcumene cyclase